jgi:hypothetical protein
MHLYLISTHRLFKSLIPSTIGIKYLPILSLRTIHTEILTTPPPQTTLRLLATRTWSHTLHVKSPEWHALRAQVIERDNRTCSSCGYVSPHPNGRGLKVDHQDGDASNNDLANLRVHCPPCEAIRHCGFSGNKEWIALARSDMDQVEIIRRTRALLEESGSMPTILEVDPASTRVETATTELANRLMEVDWEGLTEDERSLRGFFTRNAMRELFAVTIANEYVFACACASDVILELMSSSLAQTFPTIIKHYLLSRKTFDTSEVFRHLPSVNYMSDQSSEVNRPKSLSVSDQRRTNR